jgi:hypothetical protein
MLGEDDVQHWDVALYLKDTICDTEHFVHLHSAASQDWHEEVSEATWPTSEYLAA